MARKKKPCEFCEDDNFSEWYTEDRNGYCMWYEFYPFHKLLTIISQANDENGELIEHSIDFEINYCPICGRKLGETE